MRRPGLERMKAQQHPAVGYCRREVLDFAVLMERELRANDFKGGWSRDTAVSLCRRVQEEAQELSQEMPHHAQQRNLPIDKRRKIAEEAADVANMAMMVADVCGCLRNH